MRIKRIEVSQIIKTIIDLGCHVVSECQENSESADITPEMIKNFHILAPLEDEDDPGTWELISITQIDLGQSDHLGISYGKIDYYAKLNAKLVQSILLLKLYSENWGVITPSDN